MERAIGPEGGSVQLLGCRLEFPSNAFETTTVVKITIRLIYNDALEGYIVVSPEFKCFTESGVAFERLATISLPIHAMPHIDAVTLVGGGLAIVTKQDEDSDWEVMDVNPIIEERRVIFQVAHFTIFKILARYVPWLNTHLCHNVYYKPSTSQLLGITCFDDEEVRKAYGEMVQEKGFINPLPISDQKVSLCWDDTMSYRFECNDPKECKVQPDHSVTLSRSEFKRNPCEQKLFMLQPPPNEDVKVVAMKYFISTPDKEDNEHLIALEWKKKITDAQLRSLHTATVPCSPIVKKVALIQQGDQPSLPTSQEARGTPPVALNPKEARAADPVPNVDVRRSSRLFYNSNVRSPDVYPMGPNRIKGKVLIINNEFLRQAGQRRGSLVDVENLENLWNQLGFEVTTKRNLRGRDMRRSCREFALDSVDINVVVLIIMSHGGKRDGQEMICGEDYQKVSTEQIISYFASENAPHLQGIPKILMFQACRGEDLDQNVEELFLDADEGPDRYPERSDMLIVYPSQAGYASFRNRETGSWLMNAVTTVFMRDAKDTHVLDMLTKVNRAISLKEYDGYVQMSNQVNYLTKNLFLFPGWPN